MVDYCCSTRGVHLTLALTSLLTTWLLEILGNCGNCREVVFNNGTKFCLNPFTSSKVIESSNMRSRNTLAKIVCV